MQYQEQDDWGDDPYAAPQSEVGSKFEFDSDFDSSRDFSDLIRRHKKMNRKCLLFGVLGFGLVMGGGALPSDLALLASLIGGAFLVISFSTFARMRGLSGWFGLLGLTGLIGLIVLLFLSKRCLDCDGKITAKMCTRCGAPGPP